MSVSEDATVTSKGQVTIPKRIREALGLDSGTRVEFVLEDDGSVRVRPKEPPMERLENVKETLAKHDVDLDALRRDAKAAWGSRNEDDA